MSYQSKYNVYDPSGQLVFAPGDAIDRAEAARQGIAPYPRARIYAAQAAPQAPAEPPARPAQNKRAPKSARK